MTIAYFGENSFTGIIPPELITNVPQLQILQVFSNRLEGIIPSNFFSSMVNLTEFNAYGNKLTGQIPATSNAVMNKLYVPWSKINLY